MKLTWRNADDCTISLRREGHDNHIVVTATYTTGFVLYQTEIKYVYDIPHTKKLHTKLHSMWRTKKTMTRKQYLDILATTAS